MRIIEEVKIKSGTWGYVTDEAGYIQTGYVPGANRSEPYSSWDGIECIPHLGLNAILEGALKIVGSSRGRSAAGAILQDNDGIDYYMSINNVTDTLSALADGTLQVKDGYIVGKWTLKKQGDTVSLTPLQ